MIDQNNGQNPAGINNQNMDPNMVNNGMPVSAPAADVVGTTPTVTPEVAVPASPVETPATPVTPVQPVNPEPQVMSAEVPTNNVTPTPAPTPTPVPNTGMSPMPDESKKGNKAFGIIVVVLLLVIVGVVLYLVLGKKDTTNQGTNNTTNTTNNTNTNTDNNNNNTNTDVNPPIADADTIDYEGYTLTIPNDYAVYEESGALVFEKPTIVALMYVYRGYSYELLKSRANEAKAQYAETGFIITKESEKTIGSKTWYVLEGTLNAEGESYPCNIGFTSMGSGSVQVLTYAVSDYFDTLYNDLNTVINTAKEGTSSFTPNTEAPEFPAINNIKTDFEK